MIRCLKVECKEIGCLNSRVDSVAATCHDGKISMRNIPLPERQLHLQTPSGEYRPDATSDQIANMQAQLVNGTSESPAQGHEAASHSYLGRLKIRQAGGAALKVPSQQRE